MKYLGIDFGLKYIGLATSWDDLAEPMVQFRYNAEAEALDKIRRICSQNTIEKIVMGISENEMEQKTNEFGQKLAKSTKLPVVFQDETLTSKEAAEKLIVTGQGRKKRAKKDHRVAAALILQSFLDERERDLVE